MPTTTSSNQSTTSSQKENLIDLCTAVGEVSSLSNNEKDQQSIGWDEQSVAMFRQAVQTFAISMRDISTVVAEKRIRER
jgi:hypothetical protein